MRCFGMAAKQYVKQDENGADENSGIRNIERGIAVGAEPNFEEIRDRTVNDAIGDIAGRAAKQKCEACDGHSVAALASDHEPGEDSNDGNRAYDENDARGS